MGDPIKRIALIFVGWTCVVLGLIGIVLPVLPTTPFLLLAATCFEKSSKRFHYWLLNSPLFGPIIRDWQEKRYIKKKVKVWALFVIVVTFSISIYVVPLDAVRVFLVVMLCLCLFFVGRLPTTPMQRREV